MCISSALALFLAFGLPTTAYQPSPLIVLRIATGPSGQERNGGYVLDEERTQFDPSKDKQVVVLFQWQGEPGEHTMNVKWTGPDGSSMSPAPGELLPAVHGAENIQSAGFAKGINHTPTVSPADQRFSILNRRKRIRRVRDLGAAEPRKGPNDGRL